MVDSPHTFGQIPEFFAQECERLSLPLDTVMSDTAGFVAAVLAIPDPIDRVHVRLYLESLGNFNFLQCYLQTMVGASSLEAGHVAKTVLA